MILTASKIDTSEVTDLQIGACHLILHKDGNFYMVESATDPDKEYKVTWTRSKGFQCTCKAAEYGTLCWHIKASIAAKREEREAIAELNRLIAAQALEASVKAAMSDPETITRANAAREEAPVQKVKRTRANAPYQPKAFSILR